jgi:hypothetical protein
LFAAIAASPQESASEHASMWVVVASKIAAHAAKARMLTLL